MPNQLGTRTFAIRRATQMPGGQWVNAGGQFVAWVRNDGGIDAWYLSTIFVPPTGSISFNGIAPLMKASSPKFMPGTGSISFVGNIAGSGLSIARIPTGSAAFQGFAPTVLLPSRTFTIPTGSIGFSGLAPRGVSIGTFLRPAQGTISFVGKPVGGWKVTWARMKIN